MNDVKFRYLKLNYNKSKEGKQLQSNYICYMNVTFEWEKEEDIHSVCVRVCLCACACVCVLEGGWRVGNSARAFTSGPRAREIPPKIKTCIYTYVHPSSRAV